MSAKTYLTFDDIIAKPDVTIKEIHIPEWGGIVCVRNMTGLEKDRFEASIMVKSGRDRDIDLVNIRAKMLAVVLCDQEGHRLAGMDTPDALTKLGEKNARVLDMLFKEAQALSGYTPAEVEALAKNSGGDQNGSLPTG